MFKERDECINLPLDLLVLVVPHLVEDYNGFIFHLAFLQLDNLRSCVRVWTILETKNGHYVELLDASLAVGDCIEYTLFVCDASIWIFHVKNCESST